jgi:hypothetical protein
VGTDTACTDDSVVGLLSVHKYRRVLFWVYPGSLVFGEGAHVAPECSTRDVRGMRVVIEAVDYSFGSPWWWRRWPLLFSKGGMDMAADAAGSTLVPLCWG